MKSITKKTFPNLKELVISQTPHPGSVPDPSMFSITFHNELDLLEARMGDLKVIR